MKNNNKIEYVTRTDLEEQTQVIISAVDSIMDKRLAKSESRLGEKIDKVQTQLDGYVKAQEDFKEEFVIVKEEGKQMKQVFKEKLGVEIKAF